MATGSRLPTWKERENNKRRERRRRAIAAKIYAGLRVYGNYRLPKHCDNNEVLKALCAEAGWTVEADGTTYRKGSCKPVVERMVAGTASPSPCSSYQPSPRASYNPSPFSSSLPSPSPSPSPNPNSKHRHLYIPGDSVSAPVTPPLSSPTAQTPRIKADWDYAFLPSSTPPSPGRGITLDPGWLAGIQIQIPTTGPTSPTFSLISSNPFAVFKEAASAGGSSRMWTPGQSGTCSPVMPLPGSSHHHHHHHHHADVQMSDGILEEEFAFGSSSNENEAGLVKPWEGETIHEECGSDDLELTLGSSRTRASTATALMS